MMILRRKTFAIQDPADNTNVTPVDVTPNQTNTQDAQKQPGTDNSVLTSRDMLIQQMRLQRQLLLTQQQRKRLDMQERLAKTKQLQNYQKQEDEKNEAEAANNIKLKKADDGRKLNDNTNLYKSKAKTVPPIAMPKK
jgi:hypothetical protein